MAQYSVDLSINTKGYTDGIEEAKQSNAQFDSSVIKTDRSLASLKKEVGQARRAVENLAFAYAKMSKAEQQSGAGKALKRQLDDAKKYAAELKDLAQDVNQEITNMASDTAGWDAMKQGIGVAKDGLTALATTIGDVTGNEDAFKDVLLQVARVQSIANAAVSIGNALQKQSAIMIGIRKVQEAALAKAINAEAAATGKATIAQRVFNAVAKANPYVLLITGLLAVGGAIAAYIHFTKQATTEDEHRKKVLEDQRKAHESFTNTMAQSFGNLMSKYTQLKVEWERLSSAHEKNKWIKENKSQFEQLGLKINNVKDAEDAFEKNTASVVEGFRKRAEAAAVAAQMVEVYTKQLQLESRYLDYYRKIRVNAGDVDKSSGHTLDDNGKTYNNGTSVYNERTGNFEYTEKGAARVNDELLKTDKTLQNINDEYKENNKEITRLSNKAAELSQYTEKGTSGSGTSDKDVNYAKDSITALEHQLSDLQKKRKDGLLPELNTEQYLNKIKDLQDQIKKKKIELGIELPPDELAQVQQEIDTLKANQLKPELRLDAKQYQEELQRLTDKKERIEVEIGYKVEPKVDTSDADKVKQIMEDIYAPKEMNLDFSALKERLPEELGEQVQATVDRYKEVEEARKRLTEIMNDEGSSDAAIAAAQEGLEQLDAEWKQLIEDVNTYNAANQEIVTANRNMKALSASVQQVGTAVQAAGQLFTALGEASEDNSGKVMGIVAQAIATVALSFAQALTSCKTWVDWLAFGITGLATMVTMIAQINSVTGGYAEGGIIPGSSYSGDLLTAKVNSGEMILNKRQQKNLFDAIDNNKLDGGNHTSNVAITSTRIKGSDIVLSIKNQGKLDHKKYLND